MLARLALRPRCQLSCLTASTSASHIKHAHRKVTFQPLSGPSQPISPTRGPKRFFPLIKVGVCEWMFLCLRRTRKNSSGWGVCGVGTHNYGVPTMPIGTSTEFRSKLLRDIEACSALGNISPSAAQQPSRPNPTPQPELMQFGFRAYLPLVTSLCKSQSRGFGPWVEALCERERRCGPRPPPLIMACKAAGSCLVRTYHRLICMNRSRRQNRFGRFP